MNELVQIPLIDPAPLPAPYWLFKVLLVVMFILHILAMNVLLGGGIISIFLKRKARNDESFAQIYQSFIHVLPSFLAATITLGVAVLLFLQVIYGQFFYTSSVIIGWPWLLIILFLTLAYYGFYIVSFKGENKSNGMLWVLPLAVLLIALIGFIYSTNITLMLTPEKWYGKYIADPSGWNLNWDATLIPRYLHFLFAAVAVAGLTLVLGGLFVWKKNETLARKQITYGGKWFMYVTMGQIVIGIIFLITLPKEQMMIFMGQNIVATILFLIGILLAIAIVFIMNNALHADDPRNGSKLTIGLTLLLIVIMSIMRDLLRDSYMANYFQPEQFKVSTQWSVLILFLILFVAGVILWIKMIKTYFFSKESMQ